MSKVWCATKSNTKTASHQHEYSLRDSRPMIAEPFIKVPRLPHFQRKNFLPESVTICTKATETHYEFFRPCHVVLVSTTRVIAHMSSKEERVKRDQSQKLTRRGLIHKLTESNQLSQFFFFRTTLSHLASNHNDLLTDSRLSQGRYMLCSCIETQSVGIRFSMPLDEDHVQTTTKGPLNLKNSTDTEVQAY